MSEQVTEPEAVEIPRHDPDAAFGALMDALAPEAKPEGAEGGEGAAAPAAGGDGAGAGAASTKAGDAAPAAGDKPGGTGDDAATGKPDGAAAGGTDGAEGADGGRPATWVDSADDLIPVFGELSNKLEENIAKGFHESALEEVRTHHKAYFGALEKHPMQLVGKTVPDLSEDSEEEATITLRDAAEAEAWQGAVKHILVAEVKSQAAKALDEQGDYLSTLHASVEIFQANRDLIPGTKDFDVELANRFVDFASDYEIRNDDKKLIGYSIPVQHMIEKIRAGLVKEREAKPAAKVEPAGAGSTGAAAGAGSSTSQPPPAGDAPQAGLQSKAGESSDKEDFSALFGTLGLPNIPI